MAQQGQTIVNVVKLPGRFTAQKNLQQYLLAYVSGDARPDVSLDTTNENYLQTVGLTERETYLMTWEQIGTRANPNTGEELPRYAVTFKHIPSTDPIDYALNLKKFEQVFGNNKAVEEARRSKFRKENPTENPVSTQVAQKIAETQEMDFN